MNFKHLFFTLIFLYAGSLFAQTSPADFETFAQQQNGLLNQAYTKKDTVAAGNIMKDIVAKYNALDKQEKVTYKSFVAGSYYNLSCVYSISNNKPKALAYLDSSVTKGYIDYKHIQEDSDLANIRNEPGFITISNYVRSVGDYPYILKKAAQYNDNDPRKIPAFTYQNAGAPELVAIRKKFNLDSIAGKGSDSSKVINILHWVHTTVKHDGQHESGIQSVNANDIISTAKTKNVGVSCGELATTLNECYLTMGFKSRKVYCFPKDSLKIDYDSHVINVVYLPSKGKWVWADPTNDAYVMDEYRNMLGIQEVRESLIANKPLMINADANYNHISAVIGDDYFAYMTKNLYRLYSPLNNEYDYETPAKNKIITYVYLNPLDYFKQGPDRSAYIDPNTNTTTVGYRTNNDDMFWKVGK